MLPLPQYLTCTMDDSSSYQFFCEAQWSATFIPGCMNLLNSEIFCGRYNNNNNKKKEKKEKKKKEKKKKEKKKKKKNKKEKKKKEKAENHDNEDDEDR